MNENTSGTGYLLDTTDCLEAVGVFRGWKNFFFITIFLCILLSQACFWLSDLGMVTLPKRLSGQLSDLKYLTAIPVSKIITDNTVNGIAVIDPNESSGLEAASVEEAPAEIETEEISDPNQTSEEESVIRLAAVTTVSEPNDMNDAPDSEKDKAGFLSKITYNHVYWTLRFVNPILIITAFLYCFTMLFSLKISMLGRLGGINHITRAFFLSLLLLFLVLPWQIVFNGMIVGAVFSPSELIVWHADKANDMLGLSLYYMRFCGYMVLAFLLLFLAQIRSCRWAKAILRRLEII